jgi:streptogramin lyase
VAAALVVAVQLFTAPSARADSPPVINQLSLPSAATAIAAGSDGTFWLSDSDRLLELNPAGAVIGTFPGPPAHAMVFGPDGNIWELVGSDVVVVSTAGVQVASYTIPVLPGWGGPGPIGLAVGSGSVWVLDQAQPYVYRFAMDGTMTPFRIPNIGGGNELVDITAGPDGAVWFTGVGVSPSDGTAFGFIGRVAPDGTITEYPLAQPCAPGSYGPFPWGITSGPDGALWFTAGGACGRYIGRMTTSGGFTAYPIASFNGTLLHITTGPDGKLWFGYAFDSEQAPPGTSDSGIGSVTTSGQVTIYPTSTAAQSQYPWWMVTGSDGTIWFMVWNVAKVGQVQVPRGDRDLAISSIADITTDATRPAGAAVSYQLPSVTDLDDATIPAATCAPAPGSVFAIGATTVTCTAADPDDSDSPVTTAFTVTVKGAAAQLADEYQAVQGVGTGTSLADKITQAQAYLAAGDITDTCTTLNAFVNQVRAQSGKSIPAGQASQLIANAQRIQAVLNC